MTTTKKISCLLLLLAWYNSINALNIFGGQVVTPSVNHVVAIDQASIAAAFAAMPDPGENVDNFVKKVLETFKTTSPDFMHVMEKNFLSFAATFGKSNDLISRNITKNSLRVYLPIAIVSIVATVTPYLIQKYIQKYLYEPKLIAQQKSMGLLSHIIGTLERPFVASKKLSLEEIMVLDKELEEQLKLLISMTKNIKKNGGTYDCAVFYGAPGTGKTLFAEYLAKSCDMAYAIIPAANVSQFLATGRAVEELNNLFEWAARQPTGTILFFDEAEIFLGNRSRLPFEAQNALNAFLAKTGTPSDKIMIVCATNRPEVLDAAVISRCGIRIEFPLPNLNGRQEQLAMHIKNIFGNQKNGAVVWYACLEDDLYLCELATKLEGCSGRTIQKFVNRIRQQALAENIRVLNKDFVDHVLQYILEGKKVEETLTGGDAVSVKAVGVQAGL